MTYLRKAFDWFANIFYTYGAAIVTWLLLGLAISVPYYHPKVGDNGYKGYAILPFSVYTLMWIVSLLLPLSSTLYLAFDLRLRRNEIEDDAQRGQLQLVYCPESQTPEREFSSLLDERFHATCQPWELVILSTVAGVMAFVSNIVLSSNAFEANLWGYWTVDQGRGAIVGAFFGSLAGAYAYIFNKFRTFDLYPSTYLQASIGFIVGSLGGVFVGTIYDAKILESLRSQSDF